MTDVPDQAIRVSDHRIDTDVGVLFARSWLPDSAVAAGPSILLFHDSLGSVDLWRSFPARLAAITGLTVIAYDRLGFGRSDPSPSPLGHDFIAAEARTSVPALCACLGVDRLVPFGHSVGGAMAVATATKFPEACQAVVTEAAQAFVEDLTLAGIREAQARFADPEQRMRLERHHGGKAQWVLDAWIGTWLAPDFADWTLDAMLADLRCPLLAMHGDRDEYGSQAHPERIAARAGGSTTTVLFQDVGHVPHRERPELVLDAVERFLTSVGIIKVDRVR